MKTKSQPQSKSTQLLNAVQSKIIEFANAKNINLQNEFQTVEKFKEFVIAFTFKTLTDIGFDVRQAYDITLGDGAYDKLASDVWEACNANAN